MSVPYINSSGETLYFIAHNCADVVHYGTVPPGQQVETGQPCLELFDSEAQWNARKSELGVTEEA